MTPITTKSTGERIIRNVLVALMLIGYSGWSFYDGFIGYPEENLARARNAIPAEAQADATINQKIVLENLQKMTARGVLRRGKRLSEVEAELGPPTWAGPQISEERDTAYWFGPAGTLIVRYDSLKVLTNEAQFKPGLHTEKDLFIQKLMGATIGVLGLYCVLRVIGMLATSVTLSDAGLKTPKGRLIPFDAMTGMDASDFKDKGRIYLSYDAGGKEKTFTLDDYKMAAFKPIVTEICNRKGFESPFIDTPPEAPKAEQSADVSSSA